LDGNETLSEEEREESWHAGPELRRASKWKIESHDCGVLFSQDVSIKNFIERTNEFQSSNPKLQA